MTESDKYAQAEAAADDWMNEPLPPLFPNAPTLEQIVARRAGPALETPIHRPFPEATPPDMQMPMSGGAAPSPPPPPPGSSGSGGGE